MAEAANQAWYYVVNNAQNGPLGAEEIAALIHSGRVTRDTLVWKDGMATWQPAGQTELAPLFAHIPPPMAQHAHAGNAAAGEAARIGQCLKEAFGLMKNYPGPFLLGNIVFMIISSFTGGILVGNWYAGVMLMVHKARAGEPVEFGDIFKGFDRFGQALGAGLIFSFAVGLGMLFFIIPGLLAGAYLLYLVPLVAIEEMPIGEAIKASGKMVEGPPLAPCAVLVRHQPGGPVWGHTVLRGRVYHRAHHSHSHWPGLRVQSAGRRSGPAIAWARASLTCAALFC